VLDLVRRPSGGRAVLHHRELTYALVWPGAPAQRRQAYRSACLWLQLAFSRLGLPLHWGEGAAAMAPASCFASSSSADLVHANGAKRIGNAQLWRRGVLLQHGSILLDPDRELWRQVLGEEPPPLPALPCGTETLSETLRLAALETLPTAATGWLEQPLSPEELCGIRSQLHRYRIQGTRRMDPQPG
jgi:lipoate-protein ligase A